MQRVRLGEHLELGQLADESHRLVLGLDVDLVLFTDLKQQKIFSLMYPCKYNAQLQS